MLEQKNNQQSINWRKIRKKMARLHYDRRDYPNKFQNLRKTYLTLLQRNNGIHPTDISLELQLTRQIMYHRNTFVR
jgi:hypothetical protein